MLRFFSRATAIALCLPASLAFPVFGQAEVIQFPTEELATESVLPVFDQPAVVRNRVVELAKRFEVGILMGYALTEPFYNPLQLGATFTYHINEEHGINIFGTTFLEGLSGEAAQLNPIPNSNPPVNANLQYGPSPKYLAIGSWQYSAYYGKLSFTKDYVMNLHLYGLAGIGMYGLGDASKPVLAVGLGQKFHFSPSLSLRFDLRALTYMGPDPTSIRLDNKTGPQPSSAFKEKLMLEGLLNVGFSYMLPSL
jgi:outer membrane beta-barrel protein